MKYASRLASGLSPYVPGEQPAHMRYIKLNTNENAYPPSPRVAEAITSCAVDKLRLYPPPNADTLVQAISAHHHVPIEHIFTGNGSDEVLAFAFQAFFDPEIGVLAPEHTYSFYPVYAQLYGIAYHTARMGELFEISPESLKGGLPVVLANPNAPSGRAMSIEDIAHVAQHTHENGHVLIVDEAYVDFGGQSAIPLIDEFDNLLIVRTLSKSHALAGLRVGYAIGGIHLIDTLNAVKNSFNSYTVDWLANLGGAAALMDEDYFIQTRRQTIDTRQAFCEVLSEVGCIFPPSGANFVFAKHPSMTGEGLFAALKQRGILVRYFAKPALKDYIRITIGTPEEMARVTTELRELLRK